MCDDEQINSGITELFELADQSLFSSVQSNSLYLRRVDINYKL